MYESSRRGSNENEDNQLNKKRENEANANRRLTVEPFKSVGRCVGFQISFKKKKARWKFFLRYQQFDKKKKRSRTKPKLEAKQRGKPLTKCDFLEEERPQKLNQDDK